MHADLRLLQDALKTRIVLVQQATTKDACEAAVAKLNAAFQVRSLLLLASLF